MRAQTSTAVHNHSPPNGKTRTITDTLNIPLRHHIAGDLHFRSRCVMILLLSHMSSTSTSSESCQFGLRALPEQAPVARLVSIVPRFFVL